MVATRAVYPAGLAYVERAALLVQLRQEERRWQQCHADPSLAQLYHDHAQARHADVNLNEGEEESQTRYQASKKKKFVKLSDDDLLIDWYDVLKLEQQDGATEEQIRNAYRRRCLETHPDKQRNHSDELFKQVQRAFDILGDPEVRLTYDSSRPFDDAIPEETLGDKDFYATFAPVFERNKKWSRDSALPSLGTDATPIKDVVRFYDRWNSYQSWRDFSHAADLEEIHEDMPREEKRFYLRENERQLAHFKREEQQRIRALVERARKNDPRLQRQRQAEDDKRRREVEARDAFRAKLQNEQQQKRLEQEERERAKKEAERRAAQEIKDAMRQAHTDVVALFVSHQLLDEASSNKLFCTVVRQSNITWLFSKINQLAAAQQVLARLQGLSTARVPRHSTTLDSAVAADATADEEEKQEVEVVLVFNAIIHEKEREVGFTRYGDPVKKAPAAKQPAAATSAAAAGAPAPAW
ncbi:DnaJ like protein subfamily C member 2, partial [Strigomonas culicis]